MWAAVKTALLWLKDHPLEAIIGLMALLLGAETGRRKWAERKAAKAEQREQIATVEGKVAVTAEQRKELEAGLKTTSGELEKAVTEGEAAKASQAKAADSIDSIDSRWNKRNGALPLLFLLPFSQALASDPCEKPHDPSGLIMALGNAASRLKGLDAEAVTDAARRIELSEMERTSLCERIGAATVQLRLYLEREALLREIIEKADATAETHRLAWKEAMSAPRPAGRPWLVLGAGGYLGIGHDGEPDYGAALALTVPIWTLGR